MWYESPAYFFIVTALYAAGRAFDIYSSTKTGWYYGLTEANRLWRNKDGEFMPVKNVIASVIMFALSALVGVASHSWGAGCAFLILPAAGSFVVGYLNFRKAAKNRKMQIAILSIIRNGGAFSPVFITRNHKTFVDLFHWLYADEGDFQGAEDKLEAFARSNADFPG